MISPTSRRLGVAFASIAALLSFAVAQAQQGSLGPLTPGGARPQPDVPLPTQQQPALAIPPVSAGRPLEADEGPRVQVREINLNLEPALLKSAGPERVAEARALVASKLAAQPNSAFGIRELELVAESVTAYFRSNGYVLAWAYLPAQKVPAGVVEIDVLAGRLGEVKVEGNDRYSADRLAASFQELQGQPVQLAGIESAVLLTRDLPGLTAAAVLGPGDQVGTSDLTLRVSESPLEFYVTGDNYGSYVSGQYRAVAGVTWNNPLGVGDKLDLYVMQAFDPTDNVYGGFRYEFGGSEVVRPFVEYSLSNYDVGNEDQIFTEQDVSDLNLGGKSRIASAGLEVKAIRGLTANLSLDLALSMKHAEFDDPGFVDKAKYKRQDDLTVASVGLHADGADAWFFGLIGLNDFIVRYDQGLPSGLGSMGTNVGLIEESASPLCESTREELSQGGGAECASGKFEKTSVLYQRVQKISDNNALILRGTYQWSNDILTSLEQVSLGGPFSVRAYPVAEALVDQGGWVSAEWNFDVGNLGFLASDRRDISLFVFFDYGGGQINEASNPLATDAVDRNIDLAGWGGGVEFRFRPANRWRVDARLEASTPTTDLEAPSYDDNDPRFWGRLNVAFR